MSRLKTKNKDVFDYVRLLIRLRKDHPAFRMAESSQIAANIRFLDVPAGMVAYTINGSAAKDKWGKILVLFNGSRIQQSFSLPAGKWDFHIRNNFFVNDPAEEGRISLAPFSSTILYR